MSTRALWFMVEPDETANELGFAFSWADRSGNRQPTYVSDWESWSPVTWSRFAGYCGA